MNRPLIQSLQPEPGDPPSPEDKKPLEHRNDGLLREALNLVGLITSGRNTGLSEADAPDVAQETGLRLWKWLRKFRERSKEMSADEWGAFTARSTFNEIHRLRTKLIKQNEVPLEYLPEIEDPTHDIEAELEMTILVREVWQGICRLSLYQRRALLLHSAEILIYLMQFGIEEPDLAEALSFTSEDWRILSEQLPLTDNEIAKLANGNGRATNTEAARAIKKARYDARMKLEKLKR